MSNKWFWGLLVLFIVGGLSAGLLFRRYRLLQEQPKQPQTQVQSPAVQNFVSPLLTYSIPNPQEKEYYRAVVLNNLTLEDFSLDEVELKGEKKPVLNLVVTFNYKGKDRRLTVPVVDSIRFGEGDKSVNELNLNKGDNINLALLYLPKENRIEKSELVGFCESYFPLCSMYIELGFGDTKVDFGSYLESALGNQETARLDYKVAFPSALFLSGL